MTLATFIEKRLGSFPFHQGSKIGWRVRAKLAVRGKTGAPLIGLFKEGTHDVYELLDCPDHHPKINEAQKLIKEWMIRHSIAPYNESHRSGILKYIQLVVERSMGKVQASFVVTNDAGFDLLLAALQNESSSLWHSLWINLHPQPSNTIFSQDWRLIAGEKWLQENIQGIHACFLPGSFGQANLEMFERLLASAKQLMPPHQHILELYAGIGVIGLALAKDAQSLTLCENNPESKKCFDQMMKIQPHPNAHYHTMASQDALAYFDKSDLLIVDPPRKGLDPKLLQALQQPNSLQTLIYISCGAASFMRDVEALEKNGWTLTCAEGYLFFPGTPHIETLAILKR
jgi:23S rRNA (uracil1939-C5)-methyltransferase